MHGWWVPFTTGARMKVHDTNKDHLAHISDPRVSHKIDKASN
jgi:hypothetical protein